MFTRIFMRIAKAVVQQVLGQLTQQMTSLQDLVQAPIQAMVNEVTGGIWVGEGANAFVEECSTLFIPGAEQIHGAVGIIGSSINSALDLMDEADNKSRGIVDDLAGVFSSIL